jgi:hypothetical protein
MQEVVFSSAEDAEAVRKALFQLLGKYKTVSVNDYLALAGGESSYSYTNETLGWSNLGDIPIGRTKDAGFVLELPEPKPLSELSSSFPFLKGWWVVVDVSGEQTYEGKLVDEIGNTMILEISPNTRHGISMDGISKIDAYRERPIKEQ